MKFMATLTLAALLAVAHGSINFTSSAWDSFSYSHPSPSYSPTRSYTSTIILGLNSTSSEVTDTVTMDPAQSTLTASFNVSSVSLSEITSLESFPSVTISDTSEATATCTADGDLGQTSVSSIDVQHPKSTLATVKKARSMPPLF